MLMIMFSLASLDYSLPDGLLSSLCFVESSHNVNALHEDDGTGNSVGVCQIKLQTANTLGFKGTEEQLKKPDINIHYAALYLSKQLTRYYGNINKAVAAYNAGSYKESKRLPGAAKNNKYVVKVVAQWHKQSP